MSLPVLQVIVASTRPGRVSKPIGNWFSQQAMKHGGFTVEVTELADKPLPFFDEPKHPRAREYLHDHTKAWSARISRSDAFVFVVPEYNHGFTGDLKNALDFLFHEWAYKPAGIIGYGNGNSAGTRATQMLKPVLLSLKIVPVLEGVNFPHVAQLVAEDGALKTNELMERAAKAMLDEIQRVSISIGGLRGV